MDDNWTDFISSDIIGCEMKQEYCDMMAKSWNTGDKGAIHC
jgi:hypothetical protein